ncbi:MAG: HAD family hydrolase [Verrucomicrobiales bacterium]
MTIILPAADQFDAVIFDLDGTLAHTMPLHYLAWTAALTPHGIQFSEDQYYSLAGSASKAIVHQLSEEQGIPIDVETVVRTKEAAYLDLLPQVQPIEPVLNIAHEHHGKIPLAVGSGGRRRPVENTLKAINAHHLFPVIVTSDDVTHGKPAPDTFLRAAQLMGVAPERTVVVEDGAQGIAAARAAGMILVVVDTRHLPLNSPL